MNAGECGVIKTNEVCRDLSVQGFAAWAFLFCNAGKISEFAGVWRSSASFPKTKTRTQ